MRFGTGRFFAAVYRARQKSGLLGRSDRQGRVWPGWDHNPWPRPCVDWLEPLHERSEFDESTFAKGGSTAGLLAIVHFGSVGRL